MLETIRKCVNCGHEGMDIKIKQTVTFKLVDD